VNSNYLAYPNLILQIGVKVDIGTNLRVLSFALRKKNYILSFLTT